MRVPSVIVAALEKHNGLVFPNPTGCDELDDLLLELTEYDGYIVGIASTVAGGGKPPAKIVSDDGLCTRITDTANSLVLPEQQSKRIADYLESLERLRAALL